LSVLFGSIILYSAANLLNSLVTNIPQYAALRFVAGLGLAGELGAAVTLVSETLTPQLRGYGTAIIATLGLLGSVAASLLGQWASWQIAYVVGGVGGLCLLLGRFHMVDSGLFQKTEQSHNASRGSLRLLLSGDRLSRYVKCIAVGVPIYFITGILLTFAPELSREMGLALSA
jgi:MFS family permease